MKKYLRSILIFTLVYLIAVQCFKFINPPAYQNVDSVVRLKQQVLSQTSADYNSIFIGSSRVYRHVVPSIVNEELSVRSFNYGIPATSNPESYFLAERFLDNLSSQPHSVKTIFLELTPYALTSFKNLGKTKSYYWMDKEYRSFAWSMIFESDWGFMKKAYYAGTYLVNSLVKLIDPFERKSKTKELYTLADFSREDGYISLEKDVEDANGNFMIQKEKMLNDLSILESKKVTASKEYGKVDPAFLSSHIIKLNEIKAKAEAQGIETVFLILPRCPNYKVVRGIANADKSLNVLDLSNPVDNPSFYDVEYSFDNGHLSEEGSALLTKKLCELYLNFAHE